MTPDGDSATAEHPTSSIKTRLQEGFSNGWAKGWRHRDFSKQTMTRAEISEKMLPDCLWLQGYLTDRKRSPGNVINCTRLARAYYTLEIMFVLCRVIEMKEEVENLA